MKNFKLFPFLIVIPMSILLIIGCNANSKSSNLEVAGTSDTANIQTPPPPPPPPVDTHGGIIVYENNGHGLVAAETDIKGGEITWHDAWNACNNLVLNGYKDWRLPTKDELNSLYVNLSSRGTGGFVTKGGGYFNTHYYWSSSEDEDYPTLRWMQNFDEKDGGYQQSQTPFSKHYARAVRNF